MSEHLKQRTYFLKHTGVFPGNGNKASYFNKQILPVSGQINKQKISYEINNLPQSHMLIDQGQFYAKAGRIPHTLYEICRLREISFRDAGEGTGKLIDIDRYDFLYYHLILWDKHTEEIAGAYRFAPTDLILSEYGIRALYTRSLFGFSESFLERIHPAVELGRSFIKKNYQKQYSALLLLWKGIAGWIANNPKYKFLIGPVSISNDYNIKSRRFMASYLYYHHYDHCLSKFLRPSCPFKFCPHKSDELNRIARDIKNIDHASNLVSDLENDEKKMPVLIRHYLRLGGKILGFNIDPAFNYTLDCLVLVDLMKTDKKILCKYMTSQMIDNFYLYNGIL